MSDRRLFLLLMLLPALAHAQPPGPPPAGAQPENAAEKSLGTYSLVVTTLEPAPATHWLTPPLTVDIPSATKQAPGDLSGSKMVPPQFVLEGFGSPRYDCRSKTLGGAMQGEAALAGPTQAELGCEAVDRIDLELRDASTIAYHVVNHGAAVTLELNLQVHDLLPVSKTVLEAPWHAGDVVFLPVPKPTSALHVVSTALVGNWNGNAVVFEPGKPLPESVKKALEDLGIKQDLGDKMLYSYKVKEPPKDARAMK